MEKILQLHALPTDKAQPNLVIIRDDGTVQLFDEAFYNMWKAHQEFGDFKPSNATWNHLCLTSDEEIKNGDWMIAALNGLPVQAANSTLVNIPLEDGRRCRKIVATNNPDLCKNTNQPLIAGTPVSKVFQNDIAKMPQSLIQYFVEKQGNVKEVLVEYEKVQEFNMPYVLRPKLNSSGEIIWKPLEQKMYTINQIFDEILPAFLNEFFPDRKAPRPSKVFDWINKNYPA